LGEEREEEDKTSTWKITEDGEGGVNKIKIKRGVEIVRSNDE
jgi:hypothetical protein